VHHVVRTLTLTGHPAWSDLRSGTIVTVSQDLPDDVSYDPCAGDWWINVQAGDLAAGTYVTAHAFPVSNRDWRLKIVDNTGTVRFGPAGEGINPVTGVGGDEVFKLEQDPGPAVNSFSMYNDGSSSTFGAPNRWNAGRSGRTSAPSAPPPGAPRWSPFDLDFDEDVDGDDLLIFVACGSGPSVRHDGSIACREADRDDDGDVDSTDFAGLQRCLGRRNSRRGGVCGLMGPRRALQVSTMSRPIPGRSRLHAFSLIELLVAVGIITLLISILVPSLARSREAARMSCARAISPSGPRRC